MTAERYMQTATMADGSVCYRYNPPKEVIEAGVVVSKYIGNDYDVALAYCAEQNLAMDVWRKEMKRLHHLSKDSRVEDIVKVYMLSHMYTTLAPKTQVDYALCLNSWKTQIVVGTLLHKAKASALTAPACQQLYDRAVSKGKVSQANHTLAVYKVVFNFAINRGYITHNVFAGVKRIQTKSRRVTWNREHIRAFLNVAYSRYEWRNIGMIVNMAYEWGQRLGDMRVLLWSSYNFDTGVLTLTQSKRRATVKLPTSEGLQAMLKQQHDSFGWQPYIAPSITKKAGGGLKPYSITRISVIGNSIMEEAQLPEELQLMDLRRTAITEMVEEGVPVTSIMALSGHATPNSLTPYIKHTQAAAQRAQDMRKFPERLI
jgi:integrase